MAKKKPIVGRISLYAHINDTAPVVTRNYKCKADRVKILDYWRKFYQLDRKPFYIIQIEPDVD